MLLSTSAWPCLQHYCNQGTTILAKPADQGENSNNQGGHQDKSFQGASAGSQFHWDERQQGLVLGGFSYGYCATQMLGGVLAQRHGGKWVYLVACGASVVLALLVPTMTHAGNKLVPRLRVLA